MKDMILLYLDNPIEMEKLYRSDQERFQQTFLSLYPVPGDLPLTQYWHARFLPPTSWFRFDQELLVVISLGLIAGFLALLPSFLPVSEELYYIRNAGLVLFAPLSAYFIWKYGLPTGKIILITSIFLAGVIYINSLPGDPDNDAYLLICAHLAMIFWGLLGLSFTGMKKENFTGQLRFLKYNGDLLVLCALLVISGAILTGVTIGLYEMTGYNIDSIFVQNFVVVGLSMIPILATFLIHTNPSLVGKVSPVIARIFMPLVLVMLLSFLMMVIGVGGNPFQDRDFLTLFNVLLIGVMAIIFFMVSSAGKARSGGETRMLFFLAILTILIDGIALSAIIVRISEWGFTPNRTAVLGVNVLIFIHLLLVIVQLYRVAWMKANASSIGKAIVRYMPVYMIWALIVVLSFPQWFGIG